MTRISTEDAFIPPSYYYVVDIEIIDPITGNVEIFGELPILKTDHDIPERIWIERAQIYYNSINHTFGHLYTNCTDKQLCRKHTFLETTIDENGGRVIEKWTFVDWNKTDDLIMLSDRVYNLNLRNDKKIYNAYLSV